ncbi:SDR family NAD(P)-dependent oxidoreductase, partial [Escherichia coli]|uniref:SDR family NAD(P)-dependent oxidoreductase n=1 Tax=Escherichia coli TaxID=562 RepID=UPI0010CBC7FE
MITGAARGIGKGCALELARGGVNLLIKERPDADSVEKMHITQQECLAEGVEVICFPADVGDPPFHEEMLGAAKNEWGRLGLCLIVNSEAHRRMSRWDKGGGGEKKK